MMKPLSDEEVIGIVRTGMAARRSSSPPDLWPRMRRRIDERPTTALTFDLVLALAAAMLCIVQPAVISILLLHF
jgi:hypothetical protein